MLAFAYKIVVSLSNQVSDKMLARVRRAEATLSPSGGGSRQRPPQSQSCRKASCSAGVSGSNNAERQRKRRLATAELENRKAKSAARWTRQKDSDPQEKETKVTGSKGQSQ